MQKWLGSLLILCVCIQNLWGQETFPKNGVYDEQERAYAFTNGVIHVSPTRTIEQGVLVIRKGKIQAVGARVAIPKDAVQIDLKGKHIYPAFIDLHTKYGLPKAEAVGKSQKKQPQMLSNKEGAYAWNEALKPEYSAAEAFTLNKKEAKALRALGFGVVLSHQMDGIARGTSALVALEDRSEHQALYTTAAGAHFSFSKGKSTQSYPSSLMGCIALLRQTYYDAAWYANGGKEKERNLSLEAWVDNQRLPAFFEVRNWLEALRADKVGDEFGVQYTFVGKGDEYQRIQAVKNTRGSFIVPLNFPKPYDVSDPFDALELPLDKMKHWELAPSNPARLAEAQVPFAFTLHGLKKKETFWTQLRRAYAHGLNEADALAALTTTPAEILGMERTLGTLEAAKHANFFIASSNIFEDKSEVLQTWVNGIGYASYDATREDIRGTYALSIEGEAAESLYIYDKFTTPKAKLGTDTSGRKIKFSTDAQMVQFSFSKEKNGPQYSFSGIVTAKGWSGKVTTPEGTWKNWSASLTKAYTPKSKLPKMDSTANGPVVYPFTAFGQEFLPQKESVLFKNATVWTSDKQGILENTDVFVQDGRIVKIGKNIKANGAREVDATGKHLTAGIIDEHSHIAISLGVNEGTQASSAEVSIGDVVNSEDINIYRQLAGGVTMAQLLHGSANPIGGQSAIIKLRWGQLPEAMKYDKAKGFIKFALGENVKQSNWGDQHNIRFPQTRMGVEQIYEDYFTRAKEYLRKRKADKKGTRRNLELDIVGEIINKERFVTCHSYVQSEIVMLMRVAERHGFVLNTFTHILEGYKIADKMKKHGAGGSTFSDWWAYKAEVMDAIPHNARILSEMGVITCLNSDDAEMGRRLNQEAGKMVKYGYMTEEEAWKLVTINPAKLLRIDEHVGSITKGKEADLVLWNAHPMSVYARAEQTYVDGVCYFDRTRDQKLRTQVQSERQRLVQEMLRLKAKGKKTQDVLPEKAFHYHCDTQHNMVGE